MSLLEVRNLTHNFDSFGFFGKKASENVLNNVNFTIENGEFLALLGRSGSGKSTIAKILMGLIEPKSGEILLDKKPVILKNLAQKRAFYSQVQIIFQDSISAVNPRLSVCEVIEEPLLYLSKLNKSERLERIRGLLSELDIDDSCLNIRACELSGGQLQRVCIARALAILPKLVIFDEPTSSLDAVLVVEFLRLLSRLKGKVAALFITHDVRLVRLICDNVIVINDGVIVEKTSAHEALKSDIGARLQVAALSVF